MNRSLLAAIVILNASTQMQATSRPATGQEARDLKLAIEARLRQAEIDKKKAEAELKQAIVVSKKQPAQKLSKPVSKMSEQEQLQLAIELSQKEAKEEKSEHEQKLSDEIRETEKRRILDYLRLAEAQLTLGKARRPAETIQGIIDTLISKPYTIVTLQSILEILEKSAAKNPLHPFLSAINKIRYEIDRMNGIPGISFREYYKKNKAAIDAEVGRHRLDLRNQNLIDLTDFDEEHVPGLNTVALLDLRENKLTQIPESIGDLRALLDTLWLDNNYLVKIPESIGNLRRLTTLSLRDNKLTDLPQNFAHLAALQFLFIGNNRFKIMPSAIEHLHALIIIEANNNNIEIIPDWIDDLINLTSMVLANNKISELPDISKLVRLSTINLSGNEFTTAPESLARLAHLVYVDLSNNPMPYTDAQLRNMLEVRQNINLYYKTRDQEKVERALIDGIKKGDVDAVQKSFTAIMAGRIKTGRYDDEKIDISKIRDADGDNILQIVLKALVAKIAAINKQMKPKEAVDAIHDAQVNYTRIYLTLTQFGGPKVQEMMLARNKAGQDLFQAAVGNLKPDSFFVQTIREYRYKPTPAGQHLTPFRILRRHRKEENETEKLEREQVEQRERLERRPSLKGKKPAIEMKEKNEDKNS